MSNQPHTALITGGGGGIGLAVAHECAARGYRLILVGRNKELLAAAEMELSKAYGAAVRTIQKDMREITDLEALYRETRHEQIDMLVNNAGVGQEGAFLETPIGKDVDMIRVNSLALTVLTKLFLRDMIARGQGLIINIASTAAFQPGPFMAVYFATKAYVLSFTEALAEELHGTGVSVTAICPGPTATGFAREAGTEKRGFFAGSLSDPRDVARIGIKKALNGKRIVIIGWKQTLLSCLPRIVPRRLVTLVVRRMIQNR